MIFSVSMSITTYKIQNFTSSYTLMNPINKRTQNPINKRTQTLKQKKTKTTRYKMKEKITWTYKMETKMRYYPTMKWME